MNAVNSDALLEAASYVGREIYDEYLERGKVSSMSVDDRGSIRVNLMINKGMTCCSLDTIRALIITSDLMAARAQEGVDIDRLVGDLHQTLDKTNVLIEVIGEARKLVGHAEPIGWLLPPLDRAETRVYAIVPYPTKGQNGLVFSTNDGITRSVDTTSLYTYRYGAVYDSSLLKDKDEEQANELLKSLVPLSDALKQIDKQLAAVHKVLDNNTLYKKAVGNLKILRAMAGEYADITDLRVQLPKQ